MKLLYLAKNSIESEIIKHKLNQLNIKSYFIGSNLHMAIGELPLEALYVKIFVDDDQYYKAHDFIRDYKESIDIDINEYWVCTGCEEESPASLDLCWKCFTYKK
tara:strand:- start:177 stop:488 length:312 start_codon:yes stop_codon:yes gene_type:complete